MAWMRVARTLDVKPGRGTAVVVAGRELAIFEVEGNYYCLSNSCPHMDGPLAEGDLQGEVVYCPWHWWPFNVRTGEMTFDAGVCAATFPVRVEGEELFVEIVPD